MAPVRAIIASRRVVLPLWKGPTSAMHRGPRGLLTSCPIRRLLRFGARPVIGSANEYALPAPVLWQARNRRCGASSGKSLPVLHGEVSALARRAEKLSTQHA